MISTQAHRKLFPGIVSLTLALCQCSEDSASNNRSVSPLSASDATGSEKSVHSSDISDSQPPGDQPGAAKTSTGTDVDPPEFENPSNPPPVADGPGLLKDETNGDFKPPGFFIVKYPVSERTLSVADLEIVNVDLVLRYNNGKKNPAEVPMGTEGDLLVSCRVKGTTATFSCKQYVTFSVSDPKKAVVKVRNLNVNYSARSTHYYPSELGHVETRGEGKVTFYTQLYAEENKKIIPFGDKFSIDLNILPALKPESFILDSARMARGDEVPIGAGGVFGQLLMDSKDGWTQIVNSTISSSDDSIVKVYTGHQWHAKMPGKAIITFTLPAGYGGSPTPPVLTRVLTVLRPKTFQIIEDYPIRTSCTDGMPSEVVKWTRLGNELRVVGDYTDSRGRSFSYPWNEKAKWNSSDHSVIRELNDKVGGSGGPFGSIEVGEKLGRATISVLVEGFPPASKEIEVMQNPIKDLSWLLSEKDLHVACRSPIRNSTIYVNCQSGFFVAPNEHKVTVTSANPAIAKIDRSLASDPAIVGVKPGDVTISMLYEGPRGTAKKDLSLTVSNGCAHAPAVEGPSVTPAPSVVPSSVPKP